MYWVQPERMERDKLVQELYYYWGRAFYWEHQRNPERVDRMFDEWVERMEESHRHYHGLWHIYTMLEAAREHYGEWLLVPPELLQLIFGHDVAYDPRRKDNELQSVEVLTFMLVTMGVEYDVARLLAGGIMTTVYHVACTLATAQLCDLDLLSLALPPEEYRANTALIRQEYSMVSDADWREERLAFIGRFLGRPQIFVTPPMARYEEAALKNLRREREELLALVA